jgi:ABC-type uncharacterized transport system fused permease/ATPase subunit
MSESFCTGSDEPSSLKRLRRLSAIAWPTLRSPITLLMGMQVLLSLVYAWAYNYMSNHTGQVVTAIVDKNREEFYRWSGRLLLAAVAGAVANSVILSLGEYMCHVLFRRNLTTYLHGRYSADMSYYKLLILDHRAASNDPHIRISHDVNVFCAKLKLILFGTPMYVGYICTTITSVYFFYTLANEGGWFVPIASLGFFVICALLSTLLTRAPSKTSEKLAEANSAFFRAHSLMASHAEHIAFLRGAAEEVAKLNLLLRATFKPLRRNALLHLPLNIWTIFFFWGCQLMSNALPGFAWLWVGEERFTDYTTVVNVSSVCFSCLSTLSTYLLLAEEWSELVASCSRVSELVENLDCPIDDVLPNATVIEFCSATSGAPLLSVRDVTLLRPSTSANQHEVMIRGVSFEVTPTSSVVIMGPSGIGKTSLLRVLAGLWPAVGGTITRPKLQGRGGIMFVPQRPYLTEGTLGAQVYYPCHRFDADYCIDVAQPLVINASTRTSATSHDAAPLLGTSPPDTPRQIETELTRHNMMESLLREVGLDYLAPRLLDTQDWGNKLSVGEQQRLGIARVLYHQPRIAIMDESTSAVDEPTEELIFEALKRRGIAMLSVAHRSTVAKHHHVLFKIARDGSWTVSPTERITSPNVG